MNLKNSKFFKRIQELRRISKEKVRRQKDKRIPVDENLEKIFHERNGQIATHSRSTTKSKCNKQIKESPNQHNSTAQQETRIKKHKIQHAEIRDNEQEKKDGTSICHTPVPSSSNAFIQLNNVCFRVKCVYKPSSKENLINYKGSICVSHSRYLIIGRIAKSLGFKIVKEAKLWNILWTDSLPGVELYKNMKRFQQINHFPGMMEICRKDLLSRNLNRMLKLFPTEYKIFPKTWIFPADYGDAITYAYTHGKQKMFIIKPDAGAQGRGIWLTNDIKAICPTDRMICQTYITKPLLIDGFKFDLRVYTLITSVDPLRIFVYNEGLARFATSKYVEPTPENTADLFMHLTNYSVNKRNSQYELCDNDDCGSKRTFSAINAWLHKRNYNVTEFWANIDDIIIKTVLSAWPVLRHNYHACFPSHDKIQACFEILGFDILVDAKLRPYILEVNHSPSFHTNELVDRQVKRALIKDTLTLISSLIVDKRQILREDRRRVKERLLKLKQGNLSHRSNNSNPIAVNTASTETKERSGQNIQNKKITLGHHTPPLTTTECPLGALAQQIAWEDSHLGDFRRIMPPVDGRQLNYYCQFYALQNQASIYSETAASKKREEVAKKQRLELEAKQLRHKELCSKHFNRMRFEDHRRRRANMSRAAIDRQLLRYREQAHWMPGFISEAEERLRRSWLQMRAELLRSMKIIETVYVFLYTAGSLTNADILNYPDLYERLECGEDIMMDT